MSFPKAARTYLDSVLADRINPFTIELDRNFGLRAWWGDATHTGIDSLTRGGDVLLLAPWLHGLDLSVATTLPHVEISQSSVFDIHLVPDGESTLVLFMPIADDPQTKRDLQQTANEVRLLNHQQQRLLDDLAKAHHEIEEKQRETARANEVKARFIAGMSHEFRTPLTSVLGYTDLILEQVREEQELTAYAAAIGRAARHLLSMVDNVLDQARLEDDSVILHIAPVDVRQVTDDLAAIVAPLAADRFLGFGAYVARDVPRYVLTDVVRLRQVLLNVLGNAIKFTVEGEVRLELSWQDGQLEATVSDTGPGIPADEKEEIFDEFRRGSLSEGTRGAGLGLNITRRILGLLEGDIRVESELGHGSRFDIRVPAPQTDYEEPVQASAPPTRKRSAGERQKILVAEDDVDIVELVQIILGRAGYELSLAANGNEAVERAMQVEPDIILMDVNMPGLDGLGAARELRRLGFEPPIIALTASLSAKDRSKAFEAGCDGYLIKPLAAPELLSAIERFLESA